MITLGFAYQARPRISGGAYQSALKKVDGFLKKELRNSIEDRKERTALLLALDDAVIEAVQKLKDRGMVSPYLKSFVVARINPLRFIRGDLPSFEELMATMTKRARGQTAAMATAAAAAVVAWPDGMLAYSERQMKGR